MIGKSRPSVPAQPDLSPLDQIRNTEAENSRRVAAAREHAALTLQQARSSTARMLADAREAGRKEGEMQRRVRLDEARGEAEAITTRAQQAAKELQRVGRRKMNSAVIYAVRLILGEDEPGDHDGGASR